LTLSLEEPFPSSQNGESLTLANGEGREGSLPLPNKLYPHLRLRPWPLGLGSTWLPVFTMRRYTNPRLLLLLSCPGSRGFALRITHVEISHCWQVGILNHNMKKYWDLRWHHIQTQCSLWVTSSDRDFTSSVHNKQVHVCENITEISHLRQNVDWPNANNRNRLGFFHTKL